MLSSISSRVKSNHAVQSTAFNGTVLPAEGWRRQAIRSSAKAGVKLPNVGLGFLTLFSMPRLQVLNYIKLTWSSHHRSPLHCTIINVSCMPARTQTKIRLQKSLSSKGKAGYLRCRSLPQAILAPSSVTSEPEHHSILFDPQMQNPGKQERSQRMRKVPEDAEGTDTCAEEKTTLYKLRKANSDGT